MIDPRDMEVIDWAGRTTPIIVQYGSVPRLTDEKAWVEWAASVVSLPAFAGVGAPMPHGFADWRAWARKFNEALTLSALG